MKLSKRKCRMSGLFELSGQVKIRPEKVDIYNRFAYNLIDIIWILRGYYAKKYVGDIFTHYNRRFTDMYLRLLLYQKGQG